MPKTKKSKLKDRPEETLEDLPFAPPEVHYLAEHFVVNVPISDPHLHDPWELRKHVLKLLEERLGDEVQLTGMKLRKPHLIAKSKARLLKREPCARAFVTIKF
jgi:hypothetical protein